MAAALAKLNHDLPAVLALATLEPKAAELARGAADTAAAIAALEEAGELMGAARLFAFALPRREAVWWGAMCAIHTATPPHAEIAQRTREAAET